MPTVEVTPEGAVKLSNMVIEVSLDDLRSCGKKLVTEDSVRLAEALIQGSLDFECRDTAKRVRALASTLSSWRGSRDFFTSPSSSLEVFCDILGLNTVAVRDRIKKECALPFNAKLAAAAASEFMLFRQRYVNKT